MEKLKFDSGMRSYRVGEGVLRFNPGDPNVYARFLDAAEKIRSLEQELVEQAKALTGEDAGTAVVRLMEQADRKLKTLLNGVFGSHNDFDAMLQGVNLLAVAENGERVITNLFLALEPILVEGAKRCAAQTAQAAVDKANARRTK